MQLSRMRGAAAVTAAVLALAACASEDGTDEVEESTEDAAAAGVDGDETASPSGGESAAAGASSGSGGQDAQVVLAAVLDAAEAGQLTARTRLVSRATTSEGEMTIRAEGVQSGPDLRMAMTFDGDTGDAPGAGSDDLEVEVIVLDGIVYQRFPVMLEGLGVDATWLAFDAATLGPEFADVLETAAAADPAQVLQVLEQAGDLAVVGEEEVNGVPTTHLVASIAVSDALAANGLDDGTAVADAVDGDQVVQYDLWVDDQSRLRRISFELQVRGTTTSTVLDVLEYDGDVVVEAPPADETVRFEDVMAGAGVDPPSG